MSAAQAPPPAPLEPIASLRRGFFRRGHEPSTGGPLGFTQRQAAGKFTRDEAAAFIARLQGNEDGTPFEVVPPAKLSAQEQLLRHLPAEQLAAELRRRGWTVTEPAASSSSGPDAGANFDP
jgi:hypothetical protein